MVPLVVLDRVDTPGGIMTLARRGEQFSIRVGRVELMNSADHVSEDELGRQAAALAVATRAKQPRVLVGGLGLGFTLRTVLDGCPPAARIDVVELVPAVVRWNREHTGALAGDPLADSRVRVFEDDVAAVIARAGEGRYEAIVLDVDNGPDELFADNARLYSRRGLAAVHDALVRGGGIVVWSSFDSPSFTRWLRDAGFVVDVIRVKTRGSRHVIWKGTRR